MDSKMPWLRAGLIGVAALVVGCGPDGARARRTNRPGDSALSRNESGRPPGDANRDTTVRPPTTAANPAAPGSAAAPGAAAPPPGDAAPHGTGRDSAARATTRCAASSNSSRRPAGSGPVTIHVLLMGLAAGPHGMHVHMGTDCAAPGTHLNPQDAPHGPANAASAMRHLGDLGNITADASGMVDEMLRDSLLGGDASVRRQSHRRARRAGRSIHAAGR